MGELLKKFPQTPSKLLTKKIRAYEQSSYMRANVFNAKVFLLLFLQKKKWGSGQRPEVLNKIFSKE